jgi:Holliday junction resolvase RusA-like endonuclease
MKITLTTPNVTTNRLYTNSRTTGKKILTEQARTTKEAWAYEAWNQWQSDPICEPLEVRIDLYFPDHRKRDTDNIKALLDALTGVLWEDDSLIQAHMSRKHVDKDNPRIVITIPCTLPA